VAETRPCHKLGSENVDVKFVSEFYKRAIEIAFLVATQAGRLMGPNPGLTSIAELSALSTSSCRMRR
jgi:hypothetical protein